jgi:hypothetical protein
MIATTTVETGVTGKVRMGGTAGATAGGVGAGVCALGAFAVALSVGRVSDSVDAGSRLVVKAFLSFSVYKQFIVVVVKDSVVTSTKDGADSMVRDR